MRLFIKILLGVTALSVALLGYFLWVMYNLSVDQANYIKTQAARAARWSGDRVKTSESPPDEQPEPVLKETTPKPEEDKTIQVQSGLNTNQSL